MPKYRFYCSDCREDFTKIEGRHVEETECPYCSGGAQRQMPTLNSSEVTETVDKYVGKRLPTNNKDLIEQRRQEYYWKYEVPDLVRSGVYSLETQIENGWIIVKDDGTIEIQDKPPHRR